MNRVKAIIESPTSAPKGTHFSFENNINAAKHNEKILESFDFDLTKAIAANPNSNISYGSEFCNPTILDPLLHKHPLWQRVRKSLTHGAKFPLKRLNNKRRLQDLEDAIKRGNHKSAKIHENILMDMVNEEVLHGFQLPTTVESLFKIPHTVVAPYGLVHQQTIDKDGNKKDKFRNTHDQSFRFSSQRSVNDRVISDELTELIYGHAILRILHYIHSLRAKYPNIAILIGKFDIKAAYRRLHLWGHSAAASSTVVNNIGYISLRLTFGGSPCPPLWCEVSELATDLANDLLECEDWDYNKVHSIHQKKIPKTSVLKEDIPFGQAKQADVAVPPQKCGKIDSYVDDLITVALNMDQIAIKAANAVPLALEILGRPVSHQEPVPRDELLSIIKLHAEGAMQEIQVVTGWEINTRIFQVALTTEKFEAWTKSINDILESREAYHKDIDTLIGRLNHAGFIIPHARHFLHVIRNLHSRCLLNKKEKTKLTATENDYLKIWINFLQYAHSGISINNIIYRQPNHIRWDDSCPIGIGGVSMSGLAYRYHIPRYLQGRVSNNALEFLASTTGVWLDIHMKTINIEDCILPFTDSSSACGWLHKSSFTEEHHRFHAKVAEKLSILINNAKATVYAQHFKGEWNVVADSLSRDFHLSDEELTSRLTSLYPEQVPKDFHISPLPQQIICWINSLLSAEPENQPAHPPQMPSWTVGGKGGYNSLPELNLKMTNSSTPSKKMTELESSEHLPKQLERGSFQMRVRKSWLQARAKRPWTKWLRSTGLTTGATPAMVNMIQTPTSN